MIWDEEYNKKLADAAEYEVKLLIAYMAQDHCKRMYFDAYVKPVGHARIPASDVHFVVREVWYEREANSVQIGIRGTRYYVVNHAHMILTQDWAVLLEQAGIRRHPFVTEVQQEIHEKYVNIKSRFEE